MKKHKSILKNRIIDIPIEEYKKYWNITNLKCISPEYKHLFANNKFYSLPELYSPTMVLKKTIHNQPKQTSLQMQVNTLIEPTGTFDHYANLDSEYRFHCTILNYCKHWGLDKILFSEYLSKHIFSMCRIGDNLLLPEHMNPFHAFVLLPTLYNKVYDYKDLLECFSHKPTVFKSDYYSFYDYKSMLGEKGKAVTLTALYNMFDYKDLVSLGFPKNSNRLRIADTLFGYETLTVLFLGYFHPERNNSAFYIDFAWNIKIIDFLKEKIEMKRTEDYLNKYIYKLRNKKNGN